MSQNDNNKANQTDGEDAYDGDVESVGDEVPGDGVNWEVMEQLSEQDEEINPTVTVDEITTMFNILVDYGITVKFEE